MQEVLQRFLALGSFGILLEVLFTGFWQIFIGDFTAKAKTNLWMFIIYGAGGLLIEQISSLTELHFLIKALIDTVFIFSFEFTTGWISELIFGRCLWKYTKPGSDNEVHSRSIMGFIRVDYAPAWFMLSIVFELYGTKVLYVVNNLSKL
jgi:hypothetical protein